ncbi:MAG TPA: alpha/beta family hydrolase [Candidatus Udaeobacter sp.]|jgi:predicted alpha/beta-hydrolase family hydrolase|nr:alpha/beta family hydrolase [Candidatus Udaeobacter sp.]
MPETMVTATEGRIDVPDSGEVSSLLITPPAMRTLYVLAHGAGAGMRHAFMEEIARRLALRAIGTLRYQFPYTERRMRRIDPEPILLATVRAAIEAGRAAAGAARVIAGGKSMGGRMTSRACAAEPFEGVAGLAFLGFPLHPAGQPGTSRADHLAKVDLPMLFLQGTRDTLADLALLRPVLDRLGERATLHVVEGADHSFHVLKKSGRTDDQVMDELAETVDQWSGERA